MFSCEQKEGYVDRLIGKLWKMLPVREDSEDYFQLYYESLLRELITARETVFEESIFFIDLIIKLRSIENLNFSENKNNHRKFKRGMRECIDIVCKIRSELDGKDTE